MNSFLFEACSFAENRIGQRHVNPQSSPVSDDATPLHDRAASQRSAPPRLRAGNAAKTKWPVRLWQIRNIGAIYTEEVSNRCINIMILTICWIWSFKIMVNDAPDRQTRSTTILV
jgi:hypothetical protein